MKYLKILGIIIVSLFFSFIGLIVFHSNNRLDSTDFDEFVDTDFSDNYVSFPRNEDLELETQYFSDAYLEIINEGKINEAKINEVKQIAKIPIAKINLPILNSQSFPNFISPPSVKFAYFLANYGNPFVDNTGLSVFLGHSVAGGFGVGNYLYDEKSQTSKVKIGDKINIANNKNKIIKQFKISDLKIFSKQELSNNVDIWANWWQKNNQIVFITCWNSSQRNWFDSDNFVIYAYKS
ncbi:MAG: hypothetical protein LBT91_03305 [Bifidobacteriaceae bacterium]|jgi:hypothetical protein|nr:hypothetical protein [Bifidobacteriaceae bacterium]